MVKMIRQQGGWIAVFLIVGVLLLSGVVGGVYYLRQQTGNVAQVDEQQEVSDEEQNDAPQEEAPEAEPEINEGEVSVPRDDTPEVAVVPEDTDLPATGPGDVFVQAGVLSILAASCAAYIQSRRL